jgi:hypothetical protein
MVLSVIIFILLAAIIFYLYYPKTKDTETLAIQATDPASENSTGDQMPDRILAGETAVGEGVGGTRNTTYDGLLWLKNKYQQDREQATAKYMSLKAEHLELKEKYEGLQEQLRYEMQRSSDIKGKLESSGELLLRLHAQLDQLLAKNNIVSQPDAAADPGGIIPDGVDPNVIALKAAANPGAADGVVSVKAPRAKSKKLAATK